MSDPFREVFLNVAMSRVPQADYTTAPTPAAHAFVREEIKQRNQPVLSASEQNNAAYATGIGFPTDSWVEAWTTAWPWQLDIASQNLGRYLLAAMGAVQSSQPAAGPSPTVWEHVFTPLGVTEGSQLPAYALLAQMSAASDGIDRMVPDCIAKSFKLSSSGVARLDGSVDWQGSGKETDPSGVTWATHVDEIQGLLNFFYTKQLEIVISDATTEDNDANVKCEINSWNFSIDNGLVDNEYGCPRFKDDDPGLGAIRSQHLVGQQTFMQDWVLKLRADSPEHADFIDRRPMNLKTTFTGGIIEDAYNHKLEITSYLAKYTSAEDGFENGFAIVKVKPDLLFNITDNKIIEIKLTNNVESYLT